jgi:ribonuclease P protein subunit POP4
MQLNRKDVIRSELIGTTVKIVDSKNPSLIGKEGKIIDETKNSFKIAYNDKINVILKDQITLDIKFKNQTIRVDGKLFVGKPEDRIKK